MKKLNFWRFFYFWLYALLAVGVPIILVAEKYDLVAKTSKYRVTGMGIIMCIALVFYFKKQLKEFIENLTAGPAKTYLKETLRVAPILILYFALQFAEVQMHNFKFIVLWSFISNLAATGFRVGHLHYLGRIKDVKKVMTLAKN